MIHFIKAPLLASVIAVAVGIPTFSLAAQETQPQRIPMEDVQRFSNALSQIKKYYVQPTTDKELFDNAIRGMLNGLDPHSAYLDEDAFEDLYSSTSGEFGGLGIEVTMEEGVIKVVTPLVDTPAYRAGIKSGDYIIKLGSSSVQGMSLKEAVKKMRGKVGSPINLLIVRKGESKPLNISVVREKILIKSVKYKLLDNRYGYIQLTQFQATTGPDLNKAIEQLKQEAGGQLLGLILDLRNNPGGLLDAAIQVSDSFINNDKQGPEEMIVYTQGRLPGTRFTALANPGDVMENAPVVVLINNGSASASEIVAGALKDNKRAIILGTKSFGKGSVQTVLPLDEKRGIKLTTALYYTPSGTSIQATGITPDIIIEEVKVAPAEEKNPLSGFNEASLDGHLIGKNPEKPMAQPANAEMSTKADKNLLHDDYQLYAALTILKGLSVAKR